MIRLVRAELLKLRTTQVWFWLLLASLAVAVLAAVAGMASDDVRVPSDLATVFANANGGIAVSFILGILGITTEFRHQTFTPTVLATPNRWAIVSAKLLTYALVGAAYAVIGIVVQLAITVPWLASKDIALQLGGDVGHSMAGVVLVFTLFAVMGVGIGSLLRNQSLAISVGLIFLLVINNILAAIPGTRPAFPYTPEGAMIAVVYPAGQGGGDDIELLSRAGGIVTLLLWALVPAAIGAALTLNRDIT
jgi:hypothetical protein